jgi:hypothetical protein
VVGVEVVSAGSEGVTFARERLRRAKDGGKDKEKERAGEQRVDARWRQE